MKLDRQTFLETPFATLWFYPAEGIVHHQIHKYIFGAAFRELLTTGAEVLSQHGATKWLSDDRHGGAIGVADRAWADAHWAPLVGAPLKTWAIVPPASVFGEMSLRRIADERRARGLETRMFASPDEALSWLVGVRAETLQELVAHRPTGQPPRPTRRP